MKKMIAISVFLSLIFSLQLFANVPEVGAKNEDSTLKNIDSFFGKVLVAPLASVFFYDVIFWDNELTGPDLVGQTTEKGKIEAYDKNKGFQFLQSTENIIVSKSEVEPIIEKGQKYNFGELTVTLQQKNGEILADLQSAHVNVREFAKGDLQRWAGPEFVFIDKSGQIVEKKIMPGLTIVQGKAPFPIVGKLEGDILNILPIRIKLSRQDFSSFSGIETVKYKEAIHKVIEVNSQNEKITISGANKEQGEWVPFENIPTIKNPKDLSFPLVVIWLLLGAVFFTFRMGFINVRAFRHAIAVTKGDFDDPSDPGEISHFQALASALSATVGLGNIAGVAIAMSQGGPGALFWMVIAAFFGMTSKFVECSLGQMYRTVDENGRVSGGPMRYLKAGLAELNLKGLGTILSVMFAVLCIGGSFGGGGMFQSNQAFEAIAYQFPAIQDYDWLFGLVLAVLVGVVIIGGIKRIGVIAGYIVPFMALFYIAAVVWMLLSNIERVPYAFTTILKQAFNPEAMYGGAIGVLLIGFRRAAFSNEAGVGSAAIAHSAAATKEPIREGIVAMIGPFIDTIVICSMTGLAVIITGVYQSAEGENNGVIMVFNAFKSTFGPLAVLFPVLVFFFAFSTMISWSYYGERCFVLLFGDKSSSIYKFLYLFFVFIGVIITLENVVEFSDLMILGMAFPNVLGALLLSSKVRSRLDEYWQRYKSGNMKRYKS